jgi:hypothetical protein
MARGGARVKQTARRTSASGAQIRFTTAVWSEQPHVLQQAANRAAAASKLREERKLQKALEAGARAETADTRAERLSKRHRAASAAAGAAASAAGSKAPSASATKAPSASGSDAPSASGSDAPSAAVAVGTALADVAASEDVASIAAAGMAPSVAAAMPPSAVVRYN